MTKQDVSSLRFIVKTKMSTTTLAGCRVSVHNSMSKCIRTQWQVVEGSCMRKEPNGQHLVPLRAP